MANPAPWCAPTVRSLLADIPPRSPEVEKLRTSRRRHNPHSPTAQARTERDATTRRRRRPGRPSAAVVRLEGTHQGEFLGVPPTGRKVSIKVMDMIRVRDGKLCDHWGLADFGGLMAQQGWSLAGRQWRRQAT